MAYGQRDLANVAVALVVNIQQSTSGTLQRRSDACGRGCCIESFTLFGTAFESLKFSFDRAVRSIEQLTVEAEG